ncbi:hypothetical protein [Streptomyces sp. NPDC058695]|uniref:hypothetical protein n=1 Tax=Streptomyces sp. NPDC058695 TaxID=3346604 RepID=UPI00364C60AF
MRSTTVCIPTTPSVVSPLLPAWGQTWGPARQPSGGGNRPGHVQAEVTLTKYEDNAKPSRDIFAAPDGQRLVAAEFTIRSTGDATHDDPGNLGTKVIDSTGKVYAGMPGDPTGGESLDLTTTLQPARSRPAEVIAYEHRLLPLE